MGKSETDAQAQADQERKLEKKARKAERKAKKLADSLEKEAGDGGEKSAKAKKAKKADKNPAFEAQRLLAEKKRDECLEKSKIFETEAQKLLKQAKEATKMYKQITEALEKTAENGDTKLLASLISDMGHPADTLNGQDDNKAKEQETEQETKGEKKDKKKKGKSGDVETAKVEAAASTQAAGDAEEKPKKKKKHSKSQSEETNGKRKRQDDAAEEPATKKGKQEEINVEGLEGGSARQDKFLRLLGGKKAGASIAKSGSKNDSVKAEAAIQRQYEAGMQLKESGQKRRGLGA